MDFMFLNNYNNRQPLMVYQYQMDAIEQTIRLLGAENNGNNSATDFESC